MRKIAMIGTAPSAEEAPFRDESYEIWGVASRMKYVTRADRWFELHRLDGEPESFQQHWRRDLKVWSSEVDLYMLYPEPDLGPSVINYPYDSIVDRFGTFFMTSSFSWMMALAIDELRPRNGEPVDGSIGIWGVDMEYGTEYSHQRVGFRHFIEIARLLGIPVSRFANTGLSFEPVPYPIWQDDPLLSKITKRGEDNNAKLEDSEESLKRTHTMIAQNRMAIEELSKPLLKKERLNRVAFLERELAGLLEESSKLSVDIVHCCAVKAELDYLLDYINP